MLKTRQNTKKKSAKEQKKVYFDSECYSKRKELQRLGKLLSNNPHDIDIRNIFPNKEKKMIKLKKRNFKEEKLRVLQV